MKATPSALFLGGAAICIVAAIVAGLLVIGSPVAIRGQRLDALRIQDLQGISDALRTYRLSHDKLPDQLARLQQEGGYTHFDLGDPVTAVPYEYRIVDAAASTYELCAVFDTVSNEETGTLPIGLSDTAAEKFWTHPKGRHCFQFEVPPP
jgi:type II secretory pathway pseudopilin PulG